MKTEAETGAMQLLQAKDASNCQKLEDSRNRLSPRTSSRSVALLTPLILSTNIDFRLNGLQKWERINFCFQPPSLWQFFTAATENEYTF